MTLPCVLRSSMMTCLRRSQSHVVSGVSVQQGICAAVCSMHTSRRGMLAASTPIRLKLTMSKRRQRPKHQPSVGFSIYAVGALAIFFLFMIYHMQSGGWEEAVYSKRRW